MTSACLSLLLIGQGDAAAVQVNRTISALRALSSVSFTQTRHLDYPSDRFKNTQKWAVRLSFTLPHAPFAQYLAIQEGGGRNGFDGVVKWSQAVPGGPVEAEQVPSPASFNSMSFLTNGIPGLAQFFAASLKLKGTGPKISASDEGSLTVTLDPGKARMAISKLLEEMQVPCRYEIRVSKKTNLPMQITQWLERPGDRIVTEFTDWNLKPVSESWSFGKP